VLVRVDLLPVAEQRGHALSDLVASKLSFGEHCIVRVDLLPVAEQRGHVLSDLVASKLGFGEHCDRPCILFPPLLSNEATYRRNVRNKNPRHRLAHRKTRVHAFKSITICPRPPISISRRVFDVSKDYGAICAS
jgi:hypothetical protein